jgi:hypothetical protein
MRDLLRRGLRRLGAGRSPEPEPGTAEQRAKPLYVVTLSVSPTPLPLPGASQLPEIGGLTVFRARRMRGAKELHLQQLGYFESRPAAEALLPQLELEWPGAVIELAAAGDMGSLDDTTITRFHVLRPPPQALPLAATDAPGTQYYAVQLLRQNVPIELARVPRVPAFKCHAVYRVQSERNGLRTYGLRLGFFADPASARLVADSVRGKFPRAALVPVSEREVSRVRSAAKA